MSISSKIELEHVSNGSTTPTELPSLKQTILKPRNLIFILVISIGLNILLLIVSIITAGSSQTPKTNTTPTRVSPTTSTTIKPTLKPTLSPEEENNSRLECFTNCNVEDFIQNARDVASETRSFKSASNFTSYKERNCYGNYLESDLPDKEFNSYYPEICENNYVSRPLDTSIHIGDNLYTLNSSGNWNLDSKPRFGQSKLIKVIEEIASQQEKTLQDSPQGSSFKQIVSSSKTINELNQQVTKKATLTVNNKLQVVNYLIEIDNVSKEEGYFYGLNDVNNIQAPI